MKAEISNNIINCILSEDIYSDRGKLLLSKGHILDMNDINLLLDKNITEVLIEKNLRKTDLFLSDLYSEGLSKVKTIFCQAANNEKIVFDIATKAIDDIRNYISIHKGLIFQLVTESSIDDYTIQHSLNVGILSSILAELHGLRGDEITRISHAGLLHDIGKALIPKEILLKPGKLTNKEYAIIKNHAILGYEVLNKNGITDEYILSAASMHHERLNGIGYPHGLRGGNIPLVAQIVAITDVFDAITSKRVYKEPQSIVKAYQELKKGAFNNELNASMVVKFLERLSSVFEGRKVLLSNNLTGRIIKSNKLDYSRPLIEVNGEFIDLSKNQELMMIKFID